MYNKVSNPQAREWLLRALELKDGNRMTIFCQDKKDQNRIFFLLQSERRLVYNNDNYGVFKTIQFRFGRDVDMGEYVIRVAKVDLDRKVGVK